ncbi:MAG: FRG domain-containing protein [Gallionellaceae bacterium]|nr:MAG: FRG domain-containing protein [Gallionellaceae bacterium]
MQSHRISNLREFIDWTESVQMKSKVTIFRGQAIRGNLLPSIARKTPTYDSTQLERTMLDQFKLKGASMLTNVEQSSLGLMVIAQHYGLKTRLLDWTSNPLAALYFACSDPLPGDTFVYAFGVDDFITQDAFSKDPFAAAKTRVFQPPYNNPRITAQHGWFTLHRYADKNKKFVALEKNTEAKKLLTELQISEGDRLPILQSLANHGIGSHTVFPDLAGLSQHLNAIHAV